MFLYYLKQVTPKETIEHPVALDNPIATYAVDMQVSIDHVLASIAQILGIQLDPCDHLTYAAVERLPVVDQGELRTQITT